MRILGADLPPGFVEAPRRCAQDGKVDIEQQCSIGVALRRDMRLRCQHQCRHPFR
jgi:hypothetical protein